MPVTKTKCFWQPPNGIYVPASGNVKTKQKEFIRGYGYQGGGSATAGQPPPPVPESRRLQNSLKCRALAMGMGDSASACPITAIM